MLLQVVQLHPSGTLIQSLQLLQDVRYPLDPVLSRRPWLVSRALDLPSSSRLFPCSTPSPLLTTSRSSMPSIPCLWARLSSIQARYSREFLHPAKILKGLEAHLGRTFSNYRANKDQVRANERSPMPHARRRPSQLRVHLHLDRH